MYIHSIATLVPETQYSQKTIGEIMLRGMDLESKPARLLRRIYTHSDIDTRYSVIRDYASGEEGLFLGSDLYSLRSPTTRERNERYTEEARTLFRDVGGKAIDCARGINRDEITHVITVSCTGFYAPGPDFFVVHDLGLRSSTQRAHLGFMGCYAAFPALRLARSITVADPDAVVLVLSVELCTLHIQPTEEIDKIIATSVFADGAGAAIVSAREPAGSVVSRTHDPVRSAAVTGAPAHSGADVSAHSPAPSVADSPSRLDAIATSFRLDSFATTISPDTQGDMAWKIGDHGFDMVLSTYVPRILESSVPGIVDELLAGTGRHRGDVNHWAIHPGGKAILDKVAVGLDLASTALDGPRRILRAYGNMSSATILFVLKEIQRSGVKESDLIFGLAFGPGLTVESALLSVV